MSERGAYRRRSRSWQPTEAQRRVLDALGEGLSNAEIAVRLRLSPETVKWHLSELLALTATSSREELASWWTDRSQRRDSALLWLKLALGAGVVGFLVVAVAYVLSIRDGGGSGLVALSIPVATPSSIASAFASPTLSEVDLGACPVEAAGAGLAPVEPSQLAASGLISIGVEIESGGCELESSNRADRVYFRVPLSGKVLGWSVGGAGTSKSWNVDKLYAIAQTSVPVGSNELRIRASVTRAYDGPGAELVLSASDDKGKEHRVGISSDGQLWIDPSPLPGDMVVNEWTGEQIPTTGLVGLGRLQPSGRPEKWGDPVFYFTSCSHAQPCRVSYRPFAPTIAPMDGIVRCLPESELQRDADGNVTGVMELDAGEFRLRFTEVFTFTQNAKKSFSCPTRAVTAGQVIGHHYHYWIEALSHDGRPISVVVSQDSTLYVGDLEFEPECPCLSGS